MKHIMHMNFVISKIKQLNCLRKLNLPIIVTSTNTSSALKRVIHTHSIT